MLSVDILATLRIPLRECVVCVVTAHKVMVGTEVTSISPAMKKRKVGEEEVFTLTVSYT